MSSSIRAAAVLAFVAAISCGPGVDLGVEQGKAFNVPGSGRNAQGGAPGTPVGGSGGSFSDAGSYGGSGGGSSGGTGGAGGTGGSGGAGGGAPTGTGGGQVQAGTLTAGTWDDNLNFDRFQAFKAVHASEPGLPNFTLGEQQAALTASATRSARTSLDVALVIDTTGSMGDEIAYLQAEFLGMSNALTQLYPGVPQRWALVDYRDTTDAWVVKGVDFGTGLSWFQSQLNAMSAGGGGDYPESPDVALAQAGQLSWNPDPNAARLVFWVADAPHHVGKEGALADAVRVLQQEGVHVYPVAASGVDALTEYTMRASAQLTLGRYLFLTNDSGVGGDHKEPEIPCYWVTRLNHAMERAVASELAGSNVDIDPAQVLRSQGNPQGGQCALASGTVARVF